MKGRWFQIVTRSNTRSPDVFRLNRLVTKCLATNLLPWSKSRWRFSSWSRGWRCRRGGWARRWGRTPSRLRSPWRLSAQKVPGGSATARTCATATWWTPVCDEIADIWFWGYLALFLGVMFTWDVTFSAYNSWYLCLEPDQICSLCSIMINILVCF